MILHFILHSLIIAANWHSLKAGSFDSREAPRPAKAAAVGAVCGRPDCNCQRLLPPAAAAMRSPLASFARRATHYIYSAPASHRPVAALATRCPPFPGSAASSRPLCTEPSPPGRRLLVVWHSRTGLAEQMADALERGAVDVARQLAAEPDVAALHVERLPAAQVSVDDVLAADGFLFCAPENLASLSGEMKEFFDRCYYGAFVTAEAATDSGGDYTETSLLLGRPVGVAISAGSDGSSAARQVERICQGWRLRPVAETIIHRNGLSQTKANILAPKDCPEDVTARCEELGGLVAATLLL
jgi:NAD(P)H-dependent FMN reductase